MKSSKKYILLIPPLLVGEDGKSIGTQSDLFATFKLSLDQLGYEYEIVKFLGEDGAERLRLDIDNLTECLKLNSNSILIIDGNIHPGDKTGVYPEEMLPLIADSGNKKVVFIPDLVSYPLDHSKGWLDIADRIVGFHLPAVLWANDYWGTSKFIYVPSLPFPKKSMFSRYDEFANRPYDFGYVGSNKPFRVNFISSLLRKGSNKISSFVVMSNRKNSYFESHDEYIDLLSKCKFVFCARASLFECFPRRGRNGNSDEYYTKGRFAGRVSEALSAGCIPLYWEPNHIPKNKLMRRIFFWKNLLQYSYRLQKEWPFIHFLLNLFDSGGKADGWPFDEVDPSLRVGVATAVSPAHALSILMESDELLQKRWSTSQDIYTKYVHPQNFFSIIDCR
jgi:hypothetical protein